MKRQIKFLFIYISAILLFIGCTTTKNTWLTRGTNAFSTRFNVYFNGYQSYKEGIDNINKAQKDNYSQLLPMYPISIHSNEVALHQSKTRQELQQNKGPEIHCFHEQGGVQPDD